MVSTETLPSSPLNESGHRIWKDWKGTFCQVKRVQCTCIQRRGVALNLKKEHSDRAARLRTGTLKKRMPTRPPLRKYRSCSKQLNRHNVSTPVSWVSAHFLFAREPYFTKNIFFFSCAHSKLSTLLGWVWSSLQFLFSHSVLWNAANASKCTSVQKILFDIFAFVF